MKISSPFKLNNDLCNIKSPMFHRKLELIKIPNLKNNNLNLNLLSKSRNKVTDFIIMKSLWNDLGVNIEYQKQFENNINDIKNEVEKAEMINHEKNYLKKFREILIKLSEEISNRDEIVYKLKKYCNELDKYTYDKNIYPDKSNENENENEMLSSLFKSIYNSITSYRISTVNIVNRMLKVREISSYYELNNKWDASNINRSYIFRKNYLLSMYNDIEFINNSCLLDYIKTNNDNDSSKADLFFSNWAYLTTNNNKKYNLSISIELQREIIKCKYIILQDSLLNKIKKETKKLLKLKKNIFSPKSNPNHSVGNNFSKLSKKSRSEIHLINHETENKFYEIFGHNHINLSRTLYYLKKTMGDNYGKMFLSGNKVDLYNTPRNLDIMNNFFALNNNYNIINNENNEKLNSSDTSKDISEKSELKKFEMINNLLSNESDINNSNNLKNSNNISLKHCNTTDKKNNICNKNKKSEYIIKKCENIEIIPKETNEKNQNKNIKKRNSKKKVKKRKSKDKIKEEKKIEINNKDNKEMKIINAENIFIERKKIEEKENLIKVENIKININPENQIKKFEVDKIKSDFVIDINIPNSNNKEKKMINDSNSEQNKKNEILNDNQKINNYENPKEENDNINDIKKEINEIKKENYEISEKNSKIKKENNEIYKENKDINKENNEIIIKENNEINEKYNEIKKENNEIKKENNEIYKENNEIYKENKDIKKENNEINEKYNEINEKSEINKENNEINEKKNDKNKEYNEINEKKSEIYKENNEIHEEDNEILNSKESEEGEKEFEEDKSKNYITISRNDSFDENKKVQTKLFQYRQYSSEEISKHNMEYDKFY